MSQQGLIHGGITDNYNSIFLISLGLHNVIDQISKGQNIIERWSYSVPFFIFAIIVYFLPKQKIVLSYMFLMFAVFSHIIAIDPTGFNSAIVFLMAYINNKKKHMAIMVGFFSFASITYKSGISLGTPSDATMLFILYAYFFYSFYKEILSYLPKPIKARLKQLSSKENKLLEMMCAGYSQENAGSEIGHKKKQDTSRMMKEIREKLNIDQEESNYKVIALYLKYGK